METILSRPAKILSQSQREAYFSDGFIGVDWSGAKGPNLPGLQVAFAEPGNKAPHLVKPREGRWWNRHSFVQWLPFPCALFPTNLHS